MYCKNCKQNVKSRIFSGLEWTLIVAGFVISTIVTLGVAIPYYFAAVFIMALIKKGKCPICKDSNWRD